MASAATTETGQTATAVDLSLDAYLAWGQQCPVEWAREALGVELWEMQAQILEAVRDYDYVAVRSSNAIGKTYLAAVAAIWRYHTKLPGRVVTTGATWEGVERLLWGNIHQILYNAPCRELGQDKLLKTSLEIAPGWDMFGLSVNRPEAFSGIRGPEGVFVIVDEASALEEDIHEAIMGLMASAGSKCLYIGNPLMPDGPFYRCFSSPQWKTFHLSAFDSPNVRAGRNEIPGLATQEWITGRRAEWGEDSPAYISRVLGDFPEFGTGVIIPMSVVDAAVERPVDPQGPMFGGCDPARFGRDSTVIALCQGQRAFHIERHHGLSTTAVAGRMLELNREYDLAWFNVDEIGLGAGVVDCCHDNGADNVHGVNVATAARDDLQFANLRAEAWYNMADWLKTGSIPNDPLLRSALASVRLGGWTGKGQRKLEPKEKTIERLGRSPDEGDALMLALVPPLPQEQVVQYDTVDAYGQITSWDD